MQKQREKQLRHKKLAYEREQKAIKIREYQVCSDHIYCICLIFTNFQLKKELEKEQKKELDALERKKKRRQVLQDQETRERIFKREEELFRKRAEMVIIKVRL